MPQWVKPSRNLLQTEKVRPRYQSRTSVVARPVNNLDSLKLLGPPYLKCGGNNETEQVMTILTGALIF